jgi:hypothetical protein
MTLSLVSSLHVPCGKYDTWNTPGESYIDYSTLAVFLFATSGLNRLSGAVAGMDFIFCGDAMKCQQYVN